MISLISLIISLSLIMYLAYKGYSTIITAPIIGLLTILISIGLNSYLMANYTEVYMSGFAGFVKSYFPLFLTGAIFAKLMDEAGYGRSIASFITNKLGKDKAILAIVLSGAFLTYGGVSLFVVAFILYPLANILFKEADIPKRLIPAVIPKNETSAQVATIIKLIIPATIPAATQAIVKIIPWPTWNLTLESFFEPQKSPKIQSIPM